MNKEKAALLIRYGELHLKGRNRPYFERQLLRSIKKALNGLNFSLERGQGRYYIKNYDSECENELVERLTRVFGIYSISVARECEKDWDTICQVACGLMRKEIESRGPSTFKVFPRRSDKRFPMNSLEMAPALGGVILGAVPGTSVDVHNPDIPLGLEVRESAYIYAGEVLGQGGMPAGCNGKAMLLLSGGIDSPVAGHMMMKRGLTVDCVHFHSAPYTSERAKAKVIDLAKKLSGFIGEVRLVIIPFTDMQLEIYDKGPASQTTVLLRMAMMQIAERLAKDSGSLALITGESLGQVASQTPESIFCTDSAVNMPVYRPLIGFDKNEIIDRARKIDTFETSILPFEDCCTIFTPKNPVIHPKLPDILKSVQKVDRWDELLEEAIAKAENMYITPGTSFEIADIGAESCFLERDEKEGEKENDII